MSETFRTTIDIEAAPETVFDHFVRPELLVRWMGDVARLEAREGGLFSVDINGVPIRGHFVRVERPHLVEIAWGEAGNAEMPPGATRLLVTFEARGAVTRVELTHGGLSPSEAAKHAVGWPHFLERLTVAGSGGEPGVDPWKSSPPALPSVQNPPPRTT
ncbi:MAG: SRPBCC domain-containing protein [Polyangiaceae bacterium]